MKQIIAIVFGMLMMQSLVSAEQPARWYGACQMDVSNAAKTSAAGLLVAVINVGWNRGEPKRGEIDKAYLASVKEKIAAFRKYGIEPMLDFGFQYAPKWLGEIAHARYVNQYGDAYVPEKIGAESYNAVFNREVRAREELWLKAVFDELGTDFKWVRLGWGYYGELNFPPAIKKQSNTYWAFDDIAQGKSAGLADGIPPCPVPGWIPGTSSGDHAKARAFVNWYLDAQKNWHDWQIMTTRKYFKGKLCMLYPSSALARGELDSAVATDLNGTSIPERNRKVQMGHDFERFIAGVGDPDLIVYCTWVDAKSPYYNDASDNPNAWSPLKQLSMFAKRNPNRLGVWGENTGRGDRAAMELSFQRMRENDMAGIIWAFEPDLFSGKYATLEDYANLIRENR
ncbi:MAG: hypothetical protein HZC28_05740 [Spirochaetes bacterium]|nr:hypothetical protein [Spirochaetota bacterium]